MSSITIGDPRWLLELTETKRARRGRRGGRARALRDLGGWWRIAGPMHPSRVRVSCVTPRSRRCSPGCAAGLSMLSWTYAVMDTWLSRWNCVAHILKMFMKENFHSYFSEHGSLGCKIFRYFMKIWNYGEFLKKKVKKIQINYKNKL